MFNVFKTKRNMAKPWFLEGKNMPPSFHVHNSKCDNPTLAQHQRGGLSFHASWASRVSPAFSLMREIWWNAPTINHSNQRNQQLIEPKDQPQNQTQKSQPPNHPNAQTLPCPSQCYQWQSQCKVLTWSRWKRAVAPVVTRKNAPKKKHWNKVGSYHAVSPSNQKTVRQTRLLRRPDGWLHVGWRWRIRCSRQKLPGITKEVSMAGKVEIIWSPELSWGWLKDFFSKIGWVGWGCPWGWLRLVALRLVALRLVAARFWKKDIVRVLTWRQFNQLTIAYVWLNSHWQKWSSAVWEQGLNPPLVGRFLLLTTRHLPFVVSFLRLTSQIWPDRNLKGN